MGRQTRQAPTSLLVLDSGAVIALARRDKRAVAILAEAGASETPVVVPSVVVAETTRGRGPRDAAVNRVLSVVNEIAPATEAIARIAGLLLGRAGSNATIDALVVAIAVESGGGRILTSDPKDLRMLTPVGARVKIVPL